MTSCSESIVHITTAGERWDLLAWQYYGLKIGTACSRRRLRTE